MAKPHHKLNSPSGWLLVIATLPCPTP
jgi:hypothetical protein